HCALSSIDTLRPVPPRPSQPFFFSDSPPTEIYTLSLHDALPISPCWFRQTRRPPCRSRSRPPAWPTGRRCCCKLPSTNPTRLPRSEEHTSELQSRENLVCRLLLEKKKQKKKRNSTEAQNQNAYAH